MWKPNITYIFRSVSSVQKRIWNWTKQIYLQSISRSGFKKVHVHSIWCDTCHSVVLNISNKCSAFIFLNCFICEYEGLMFFHNKGNHYPSDTTEDLNTLLWALQILHKYYKTKLNRIRNENIANLRLMRSFSSLKLYTEWTNIQWLQYKININPSICN